MKSAGGSPFPIEDVILVRMGEFMANLAGCGAILSLSLDFSLSSNWMILVSEGKGGEGKGREGKSWRGRRWRLWNRD